MGERRYPPAPSFPHPEGMPCSVGTIHDVARPGPWGQRDELATIGAANGRHRQIPKSRLRRPRSKPTITSSSTEMTGTAIRPVLVTSSLRAAGSSATFLAVNSIP